MLKLGGSVITFKDAERACENIEAISRLSKEIVKAYREKKFKLVLVHGAGSYGHEYVKRTGIDKGIVTKDQLLAFAEVQRLQNVLNSIITKQLINVGLPAIPCQPSSFAVMERGRLVKFDSSAIVGMLDIGLIPVLYGVPAYDKIKGCSILSGDQTIAWLGKELGAKRIIHGTDVDGIFTADPKRNPDAKLIREINRKNIEQVKIALSGSAATDVTGGMWNKVMEIAAVGIETQIINARIPWNVYRALCGEKIGTIIKL